MKTKKERSEARQLKRAKKAERANGNYKANTDEGVSPKEEIKIKDSTPFRKNKQNFHKSFHKKV